MKMSVLGALLRKEVLLMKRNPIIPKVIVMMPLMVMLVIPLVATMDVKNVGVVVVDNDRTELSRQISSDINASESLDVRYIVDNYSTALEEIRLGNADVIVDIPPHFSRDMVSAEMPQIDVEANGVNATKGVLGAQYTVASIAATLREYREAQGMDIPDREASVIYKYNPTLNFRNFMIPALMVMLLIIICGFLPAMSIVQEKQSGTIEAMNVTPVSKLSFVLSKLIPYWIAGIVVITVGILVGRLVYGLAPVGNIGLVYLASMLFSMLMAGLGVVISNKSSTLIQSIFMMFAIIVIFQLMSGLFTPISSMPEWAQTVTWFIPPRYFIEIMRDVYLKGTTFTELLPQFGALALFTVLMFVTAALTYRKQQ